MRRSLWIALRPVSYTHLERTEIAAVKVRIAHGFARFHACAHRVFDAPQRARQGKNYLNTRVFAARARRFVGIERQNDRFQHGNVFRHLRAVFEAVSYTHLADIGSGAVFGYHALTFGVLCFLLSGLCGTRIQIQLFTSVLMGLWSCAVAVLLDWLALYVAAGYSPVSYTHLYFFFVSTGFASQMVFA